MSKERKQREKDPFAARLASPLFRVFERMLLLVKLHFMMLAGILAGLGIFGFFPTVLAALVYGSLLLAGAVWYLLWYLRQPLLAAFLNLIFFLALLALLLLILYYPVLRLYYAHMSEKRLRIFAVVFGFGHIWTTVLIILTGGAILFLSLLFPQLSIFVGLSLLPWITLLLCRRLLPPDLIGDVTVDA